MDLTTTSGALTRELGLANRIISRKPTIPVLANVLMQADAGLVTFTATDLELALRSTFPATVGRSGVRTVPAQKLHDLLRTLPDAEVRLVGDDKAVGLTAAGFRAKLQTLPAEDFPSVPSDAGVRMTSIPARVLQALIPRVRFAASEDDKRYFMAGAHFEIKADAVRMVATDSHRLALAEIKFDAKGALPPFTLLPKKTLDALMAVLEDVDGDVACGRSEAHLFFATGTRMVISRTIDGQFPAYERILPKDFKVAAVVPRAPLAEALRRATMVADTAAKKTTFALATGGLTVSARSAEVGDADERVAFDYDGEEFSFSLNGGYVLDFLDAVGTDEVTLQAKGSNPAVMFSAVGGDVDYKYVVMPVIL